VLVLALAAGVVVAAQAAPMFTVVAMPDTQNEAQFYPAVLNSEVGWVASNVASNNIVFAVQQGDLINNGNDLTQWSNAATAMYQMDGKLPWGTCSGNHEYMGDPTTANYINYFGAAHFAAPTYPAGTPSWYGGSDTGVASALGRDSWETFSANGRNFLVLNIGYDAATDVLNWAQGVINSHPNWPTIINTHDYLVDNPAGAGGRSSYGNVLFSGAITGTNANPNGLIYGNSQVFMVICGHQPYEWNQTSTDAAGQPVFELLANYQDDPYGGDGYMRLYQFDENNSMIHVKTYSPYDTTGGTGGTFRTAASSQFDIPVNFNARFGAAAMAPGTVYWTGAQNTSWSTLAIGNNTNWNIGASGPVTNSPLGSNTNALPGSNTNVVFAAPMAANCANTTLDGNFTVNSLTFSTTGAVGISAGAFGTDTLTIAGTGGITATAGGGAATITAPLALGASQTWTNNSFNGLTVLGSVANDGNTLALAGSGNTTISAALSGGGGLTMLGPGGLILSGADTYSGGTNVEAGTLIVQSGAALLDGSNLTVGDAATLAATAVPAAASPASDAAVPEPGTWALLCAAGLVAAESAWRRRKTTAADRVRCCSCSALARSRQRYTIRLIVAMPTKKEIEHADIG
jgi:autotransporter-associated beta strand protein